MAAVGELSMGDNVSEVEVKPPPAKTTSLASDLRQFRLNKSANPTINKTGENS